MTPKRKAPGEIRHLYSLVKRAIRDRDLQAVESLIRDHPALCTYEGPDGGVPYLLSRAGPEVLEAALRGGLNPDSRILGDSPILHDAAAKGDLEVVSLVIRYGADLESRNEEGETALGYAVSWDCFEIVRFLVEAGADVNAIEEAPEGFRNTALDCCRNVEIEKYLRSRGGKTLKELEKEKGDR